MNEFDKEKLIEKDIKAVENRIRHAYNQGYEAGYKSAYQKGYSDAMRDFRKESKTERIEYGTDENSYKLTISNGKEFEQEPKWIPCTERLPEKNGLYLVSGKGKVWICEMLNLMGLKGWCGDPKEPIVEAWMPLPEPYKTERDE